MILEWVLLAAVSAIVACGALIWIRPLKRQAAHPASISDEIGLAVFLFDGSRLIGASTPAQTIIGKGGADFDWASLHKALRGRFPGLPKTCDVVREQRRMRITAQDAADHGEALCEWIDGIIRVQLREDPDKGNAVPAQLQELQTLRAAMHGAPYPVWRSEASGRISWFNQAYEKLCRQSRGGDGDPARALFPCGSGDRSSPRRRRESVPVAGSDQKLWFDISEACDGSARLCYAIDINAVVDAEIAQRNFVQTLAKTFAQLSIGLAIFDRNRQLALFNPALIDLTALPADFLTARPNLLSFFDRLRDQRMMPEPKNYGSWRHQMADLVAAATDGRYQETWSLPSGSVYSVSGRPHPDGAVAFLFDDITAEITLTRRFRSDLELGQAILDRLDDAIAVFSADGCLSLCNAAYRELWEVDPEKSFARTTVVDATRNWQDRCMATPAWGELRDFVVLRENRAEWWARVRLKAGQDLAFCVYPVQNGATMVRFTPIPDAPPSESGHESKQLTKI